MPISLRLDRELEKKITHATKKLNITKTEIIRRSLKRFLSEVAESTEPNFSYTVYHLLEEKIPDSGHGYLSINHRAEVLKRVKKHKIS